ncbi:hypothetical protein SAMN05216298_2712 [Glycomyces sambucus]|uniref:Uncharacterized protein n=1 Tax=Glycomyces sambucus TaxID=380244 RepID=A0A1G9HA16_9ACTN|nr:hypothetical protein [Glycomyces sambucus]SDL09624.1 hypothetical protein SAMN05216298_2712 [Glycomyces sambucus]
MTDDLFATGDSGLEPPSFGFTIAFGAPASGGGRAGCSAGACPHPVAHPAEEDWVQLASAVPVEGQSGRLRPRCEGMAYPTEADFRAAVAAVRPEDADAFSLQRLRTGWTAEVGERIAGWPERLRSKLAVLAEGWAGDDFDVFAEQADLARALVEGALDDLEGAAAELERREAAVYTLQGGDSGEIPYPAPLVGVEGEWSDLAALHVRPAWWHGDCITMTCAEAERALELAGADPGLASEVREFVEERVGAGLSGLGALVADVRSLAGQEAKEVFGARVEAELAAYVERQPAIDESITAKRDGQSAEFAAVAVTGEDRPYPASADASYMDLVAPEAERPADPVVPQAVEDPSPVPPGGDGSVRAEETPWEPAEDDDDEAVSGGLAGGSGGSFGAGGAASAAGALGSGPGGRGGAVAVPAGGVPQGLFGPAVSPGATAGGTGAAKGGGLFHGPGPAGQQVRAGGAEAKGGRAKADDEDEDAPQDLARRETGNPWGYVRPNEDPYN